jgi:hypothetical protein
MDKKLINEDIKNMKYLFGYKAGRVISEQNYDYTTEGYLDTELDEDLWDGEKLNLNTEKERPERIVKHSDTGKVVGTYKHGVGYHPSEHGEELGFEYHPTDIPYGAKFGGTEIGDFDYEEGDFNEEKDDNLFEQDNDLDEEEIIESLIEKYINEVEEEGTYFGDEFEFADNIISWVIDDLTNYNYEDNNYDELEELIKDNYGDYILSRYVESDFNEDDNF